MTSFCGNCQWQRSVLMLVALVANVVITALSSSPSPGPTLAPTCSGGYVFYPYAPSALYQPTVNVSLLSGQTGYFQITAGYGAGGSYAGVLGIAIDRTDQFALISDANGKVVRKLNIRTTYVGNDITNGYPWHFPMGLTFDSTNAFIYVSDRHLIARMNNFNPNAPVAGEAYTVTSLAGSANSGVLDSNGTIARFNEPRFITLDLSNKYLFVSDVNNFRIRRIDVSNPQYVTVTYCSFLTNQVTNGIVINSAGNYLYAVATTLNGLWRIPILANGAFPSPSSSWTALVTNPQKGQLIDGQLSSARFAEPTAVAIDNQDNLYVMDNWDATASVYRGPSYLYTNYAIRRVSTVESFVTTIAGRFCIIVDSASSDPSPSTVCYRDGNGTTAGLLRTTASISSFVAVSRTGGELLFTDQSNNVVRQVQCQQRENLLYGVCSSCPPTPTPTLNPSTIAPSAPTVKPSCFPSIRPSTITPSSPTLRPSLIPSNYPSRSPTTFRPSRLPSISPSNRPSASVNPSRCPTFAPSSPPSLQPSTCPSTSPTRAPSYGPSRAPSISPSTRPSADPSMAPTPAPSVGPSLYPSFVPTITPTSPTVAPSCSPSCAPAVSNYPTTPSVAPSPDPTTLPSIEPTAVPSTAQPSAVPSSPTCMPSTVPVMYAPSVAPTSMAPTESPSAGPTAGPSTDPSCSPTALPSNSPTLRVSTIPSQRPSADPTAPPSLQPSSDPSNRPSSMAPSYLPTFSPSSNPTTYAPSRAPTVAPSTIPSTNPTLTPTYQPTYMPSIFPSASPTIAPTRIPPVLQFVSSLTISNVSSLTLDEVSQQAVAKTCAYAMGLPVSYVQFVGATLVSALLTQQPSTNISTSRALVIHLRSISGFTLSADILTSVPFIGKFAVYQPTPQILYEQLVALLRQAISTGTFTMDLHALATTQQQAAIGSANVTSIFAQPWRVIVPTLAPSVRPTGAVYASNSPTEAKTNSAQVSSPPLLSVSAVIGIIVGGSVFILIACLLAVYCIVYYRTHVDSAFVESSGNPSHRISTKQVGDINPSWPVNVHSWAKRLNSDFYTVPTNLEPPGLDAASISDGDDSRIPTSEVTYHSASKGRSGDEWPDALLDDIGVEPSLLKASL